MLLIMESAGEHLTGQALAYYQKTKNRIGDSYTSSVLESVFQSV